MSKPLSPEEHRLRRVIYELEARPRMYLADAGYLAIASFIQGVDSASGGRLLDGIQTWIAEQWSTTSSVSWVAQVPASVVPGYPARTRAVTTMTDAESAAAVETLFETLRAFWADRDAAADDSRT